MAGSLLKYIILMAIVCEWQDAQAARYMPSIIWDKYNNLLTCKCNWLMNIPKLDTYDRIELLCPEPTLMSSMQEYEIPKQRLFYSMYSRKFDIKNNKLEDLKKALNNGSFCDPSHNETKILHSCKKNKKTGDPDILESYKLRIHSDEDLHPGELVVIFCNEDTGLKVDLDSRRKQCSMVFIVNITSAAKITYEHSYGKCALPTDSNCMDSSKDRCPCENIIQGLRGPMAANPTTATKPTMGAKPPTEPGAKPTAEPKAKSTTDPEAKSNTAGRTDYPPATSTTPLVQEAAQTSGKDGFQAKEFAIGLVVGIAFVIFIILFGYVCVVNVTKKGKVTFVMIRTERPSTVSLQEKKSAGVCFPNQAFQPTTPTAPPPDFSDVDDHVYENDRPCNGRLPSVEINNEKGDH